MIQKGVKLMRMRLQKDLYKLLHRVLLFYVKLAKDLKNTVLVMNPYNQYVANKLENEEMREVVWYAYDLKMSHRN